MTSIFGHEVDANHLFLTYVVLFHFLFFLHMFPRLRRSPLRLVLCYMGWFELMNILRIVTLFEKSDQDHPVLGEDVHVVWSNEWKMVSILQPSPLGALVRMQLIFIFFLGTVRVMWSQYYPHSSPMYIACALLHVVEFFWLAQDFKAYDGKRSESPLSLALVVYIFCVCMVMFLRYRAYCNAEVSDDTAKSNKVSKKKE